MLGEGGLREEVEELQRKLDEIVILCSLSRYFFFGGSLNWAHFQLCIEISVYRTHSHAFTFLSAASDLRSANKQMLSRVQSAVGKGYEIYMAALAQQQILDALLDDAVDVQHKAEKARGDIRDGILGLTVEYAFLLAE